MSEAPVMETRCSKVEWQTLALIVVCYGLFVLALWVLPVWLAVFVLAPVVALHGSLTHEVIHGHPFRNRRLNAALVFPALTLTVPYERFRATHLAHHNDERLTDPYDDPESNYLDPKTWDALPSVGRVVLRFNNTLFGRLMIGPVLGQGLWMISDFRAARAGDRDVLWGWVWHIPAAALVLAMAWVSPLPFWAFLLGVYLGHSILRIRTYLEHRAHEDAPARTVIVEDRGPLALLFLNNNLHVVHHMYPGVPWYRLPALYRADRAAYLERNDGYLFTSYAEVLRRHFWKAKDPVPHPLWSRTE